MLNERDKKLLIEHLDTLRNRAVVCWAEATQRQIEHDGLTHGWFVDAAKPSVDLANALLAALQQVCKSEALPLPLVREGDES